MQIMKTKTEEIQLDQISNPLVLEMLRDQSEVLQIVKDLRDRIDSFKQQKWVSRQNITETFDISYYQVKKHIQEGTFKLGIHYIDNAGKDSSLPDYRFNPIKIADALGVPREKRK